MEDLKLAILIDADNISPKYVKVILDEAANFGVAACKRIYGDWSDARLKSWKDALLNNSIIPIQQYSYTTVRIIHVVNHMFYKGKVSLSLRCKLSSSAVSWVIFKLLISRPLQAIRWIADLYSQLQIITVLVILQGITFVDVKILPVYTMHNHIHS